MSTIEYSLFSFFITLTNSSLKLIEMQNQYEISRTLTANSGGHKEMSFSWLTNSALVYEPKFGGGGGGLRGLSSATVHMEPK